MNIRYTSALLLVTSFLVSSLLLGVTPHIAPRSQGQNIVHTALQRAKMHCTARDIQEEAPVLPALQPVTTEIKKTDFHQEQAKNISSTPVNVINKVKSFFSTPSTPQTRPILSQEQLQPLSLNAPQQAEKKEPTLIKQELAIPDNSSSIKTATKKNTPLASKKKSSPKKLKDTPSTLITPKKSSVKKRPATHLISSDKNTSTPLKPVHVKYRSYQQDLTQQERIKVPTPQTDALILSSKNALNETKKIELLSQETTQKTEASDVSSPTRKVTAVTEPAKAEPAKAEPVKTESVKTEQKNATTRAVPATTVTPSPEKSEVNTVPLAPQPVKNNATATLYPNKDDVQQPIAVPYTTKKDVTNAPSEQPATATTTSWLSRIKKYYQKGVDSVRDFIKGDTTPAIQSIPINQTTEKELADESFSPSALYKNNAALEVASIDNTLEKSIAGNFALLPEVTRSCRPHALARALFGCDLYNDTTLHIRGSAIDRNEDKDWLADYFYLSNNYEGVVCFTPRVTSFSTDMQLFIDLNSWFNGCFLRVQSPLTWTKWQLGMREHVINSGKVTGAHGWKDTWTSVDNRLLSSFTDYACWEKAGTSYIDGAGLVYPLYNAKMCPCGASKTALADIHVDFGIYEHKGNRYQVSAYTRGVMPTGTHPDGEFLFEPIVGNGHHWELGAGLNSYAQLWTDKTHSKEVGFYVDCSLTHLFGSHEQRVFDLKNHGPLSRYLLVTNSTSAPASITPAANITRAQVTVSVPVQVDLVALLNYANDVFSWNVGYNFWTRSCEKIDCCGIASSYVCDNCSAVTGLDGVTWKPYTNATIKNLGTGTLENALTIDDLDLAAARTKSSSHKLFSSLNYSWRELDDTVVPFLGIGAELELGNTSKSSTNNSCCNQSSLSQWGLWLRAGTDF